jgi:hypothetical protein
MNTIKVTFDCQADDLATIALLRYVLAHYPALCAKNYPCPIITSTYTHTLIFESMENYINFNSTMLALLNNKHHLYGN